MLSNQPGTIFDEFAVFMVESSKKVTIDIEFADDFVTGEHWHDDLRLGFDGAGEIAGVTIDIIHDELGSLYARRSREAGQNPRS